MTTAGVLSASVSRLLRLTFGEGEGRVNRLPERRQQEAKREQPCSWVGGAQESRVPVSQRSPSALQQIWGLLQKATCILCNQGRRYNLTGA